MAKVIFSDLCSQIMPISLQAFGAFMQNQVKVLPAQKILLAFSGGVDSVVLATLLKENGYTIALAHCNFSLRADESDGDEDFARSFAQKLQVPFFSIRFDTLNYAKQHKVSTQVAARQLRYNWFYELMGKEVYDLLATAHHQTDQVETMLFNVNRGTGLAGLQGMKLKEDKLVRPLLMTTRSEIEEFAKAKKLKWREDSSNSLNKYSRNKLRNVVLPVLKGLNPNYEESFYNLSVLVGQYRQLIDEVITANTATITHREGEGLMINKTGLLALPQPQLYLYELLKPYGFSNDVVAQMAQSLAGHSGTVFYGEAGEALIDREAIIVRPLERGEEETTQFFIEATATGFAFAGKVYTIRRLNAAGYEILQNPAIVQLDVGKLQFPLSVRSWKKGDYFYPLGMRKKKKVSDVFINLKVPLFSKGEFPLLFSGDHLVCIAGLRVDDRFKVTPKTKEVLVIALA